MFHYSKVNKLMYCKNISDPRLHCFDQHYVSLEHRVDMEEYSKMALAVEGVVKTKSPKWMQWTGWFRPIRGRGTIRTLRSCSSVDL